jgi:hypothetical protein
MRERPPLTSLTVDAYAFLQISPRGFDISVVRGQCTQIAHNDADRPPVRTLRRDRQGVTVAVDVLLGVTTLVVLPRPVHLDVVTVSPDETLKKRRLKQLLARATALYQSAVA